MYFGGISLVSTLILLFLQLVEQLKVYYDLWETKLNIKQSLSLTSAACHPILSRARDPSRSSAAAPLVNRPRTVPAATKGFNLAPLHVPSFPGPSNDMEMHPAQLDPMDVDYANTSPQTISSALVNRRVANDAARYQPVMMLANR